MVLPSEIEYMVILFNPDSSFCSVCKEWNAEIKRIRKNAVNIIGSWYKQRLLSYHFNMPNEIIRYYILEYPSERFISHPEQTVQKLNLNDELLSVLHPLESRKRSDVRDWMMNLPLTFDDWVFVGW